VWAEVRPMFTGQSVFHIDQIGVAEIDDQLSSGGF
jgi:hypothetical protein